jgi:predicted MFS family arabinose efflux permease
MTTSNACRRPATIGRRYRTGFLAVVFAFLVVMSFATLPSPLYGLYRERDHLSTLMVTVVYAVFAGGTIAALLCERVVVARVGRRGAMLGAVATMIAAAALIAAWKALPGLLVGRVLTGAAIGLAAGTATAYLIELRLRDDPNASVVRAQTIGTSVNVGALGLGPLIGGVLAEWTSLPLTLPYIVFIALGAAALVGLTATPETGTPNRHATATLAVAGIPVPAGAATIAAFSATGLFAGLAGLFLAETFGQPSHALSGATLFLVFSCGAVSQLATTRVRASHVLTLGVTSMVVGLALLVTSVRLSTPSLALFLVGGALIGAGAGLVFKGTSGIVLAAASAQDRVAMTSTLIITAFIGLSIPVIGAGVALSQGASASDTLLVFGIAVALGVVLSGWALLGRRARNAERQPSALSRPSVLRR